jgi:hypothetical protein
MTAIIIIIIIINSQQFVANNKQQWDERALNIKEVPRILMLEPLGRHARLSIVVFPTDPEAELSTTRR